MAHSKEKSQFLHGQKDAWDCLAKEAQLHGCLTEQLDTARQKVVKLAPTGEEVASLRIKEVNARRHANEAEEKFTALVERARLDGTKTKRIRKERDELLPNAVRLR
jgi:hypothetical protein